MFGYNKTNECLDIIIFLINPSFIWNIQNIKRRWVIVQLANLLNYFMHYYSSASLLQMYVTLVFQLKGSRLAKPSICLSLLCPAFLVGVVRVAEYRNHWSDVLAGFITGGAIATFLVSDTITRGIHEDI